MKERNYVKNMFIFVLMLIFLTGCGMIHLDETNVNSYEQYEHIENAESQEVQMDNIENNVNNNIEEEGIENKQDEDYLSDEEQVASIPSENNSKIVLEEYGEQESNMEDSFPIQLDVVETSNVTKLQVRSGSTGEELIIEDIGLINAILDSLKSFDIEKHENGNVQGYLYSISSYNDDNLIQKMFIRGDSIEVSGTIYYVGSTQDIVEYICSLENE